MGYFKQLDLWRRRTRTPELPLAWRNSTSSLIIINWLIWDWEVLTSCGTNCQVDPILCKLDRFLNNDMEAALGNPAIEGIPRTTSDRALFFGMLAWRNFADTPSEFIYHGSWSPVYWRKCKSGGRTARFKALCGIYCDVKWSDLELNYQSGT